MTSSHEPSDVLRRLVRWADRKDPIRAVLLTSTRARPHAPVDALSDYDAVLVAIISLRRDHRVGRRT